MPTAQPARRPRAARLPPEERRARLLDAAIHVFARRGIGAARPSEVAVEAEVSEATVYTYFPTRAELRDAVLRAVGDHYYDLTRSSLDASAGAPLAARLGGLIEEIAESVERDPDHARVWVNWGAAIRDEVWPAFLENENRSIDLITSLIDEASDDEGRRFLERSHPEDLARLIIGTCETMVRLVLAGHSPETIDRFVRSARVVLFDDAPA